MSWDVMLFKFAAPPPKTIEGIEGATMLPLGPAEDVRQKISTALGGVDWTDPTWGLYGGDGFSIEFNVGDDDPIENIMLHVRGGGDAIATIMSLAVPLGWSALDCSTSDFIDPDAPSQDGWKGFQAYRDKILDNFGNRDEE